MLLHDKLDHLQQQSEVDCLAEQNSVGCSMLQPILVGCEELLLYLIQLHIDCPKVPFVCKDKL